MSKPSRDGTTATHLDYLAGVRGMVLGPLVLRAAGAPPTGVRRLERLAPGQVDALARTVGAHDPASLASAIRATIELYRALRASEPSLRRREQAEAAAVAYLDAVMAAAGSRMRR